jgi:hypothetical protein
VSKRLTAMSMVTSSGLFFSFFVLSSGCWKSKKKKILSKNEKLDYQGIACYSISFALRY